MAILMLTRPSSFYDLQRIYSMVMLPLLTIVLVCMGRPRRRPMLDFSCMVLFFLVALMKHFLKLFSHIPASYTIYSIISICIPPHSALISQCLTDQLVFACTFLHVHFFFHYVFGLTSSLHNFYLLFPMFTFPIASSIFLT